MAVVSVVGDGGRVEGCTSNPVNVESSDAPARFDAAIEAGTSEPSPGCLSTPRYSAATRVLSGTLFFVVGFA